MWCGPATGETVPYDGLVIATGALPHQPVELQVLVASRGPLRGGGIVTAEHALGQRGPLVGPDRLVADQVDRAVVAARPQLGRRGEPGDRLQRSQP